MKKIMDINDVFELPGHGVILSGTNPDMDAMSKEDIHLKIGKTVIVRLPDGQERNLEVKEIDAPSSLIGKRNINISIGHALKVSDLQLGSSVWSP